MTVAASSRHAGPFSGNGATTAFPFTFKVFDSEDVAVYKTDANGVQSRLVGGYSVALNADQDASPGGTVTYPSTGTALAVGEKLDLLSEVPYTQTTDIINGGRFNADVNEQALDKGVILGQQNKERLDRALVYPVGDNATGVLPSAADRASSFLAFDASGNPIASDGGISSAIPVSAFMQTVLDDTTSGAAAATLFADSPAARDALGVGSISHRNKADNGGMMVATRTSAPALSTTAQVGRVDRFMVWASGGAVSAGTITQDTAATIGRTGYALHVSGVTLTGAGVLSIRQRLRSERARQLRNARGVFSCQVLHDVGTSVNYTVIVRKPTAANNFGAVTTIVTGSAQAVPSGAGTQVTLPSTALGDVSNGIEVELQIACGAVTTKNFRVTEWQLEEGLSATSVPTTFEQRPYGAEVLECARFLPAWTASGALDQIGVGQAFSATQASIQLVYEARTYTPPTGIAAVNAFQLTSAGGGAYVVSAAFALSATGTRSALVTATAATGAFTGADATTLQSTNAASQLYLTGAEI